MRFVQVDSWKIKGVYLASYHSYRQKYTFHVENVNAKRVEEPDNHYFKKLKSIYLAQHLHVTGNGSGVLIDLGYLLRVSLISPQLLSAIRSFAP